MDPPIRVRDIIGDAARRKMFNRIWVSRRSAALTRISSGVGAVKHAGWRAEVRGDRLPA